MEIVVISSIISIIFIKKKYYIKNRKKGVLLNEWGNASEISLLNEVINELNKCFGTEERR